MVKIEDFELESINGGFTGPCFRYTISKGDMLCVIAQKFGSSVSELCSLNSIADPKDIKVGDNIYIPARN